MLDKLLLEYIVIEPTSFQLYSNWWDYMSFVTHPQPSLNCGAKWCAGQIIIIVYNNNPFTSITNLIACKYNHCVLLPFPLNPSLHNLDGNWNHKKVSKHPFNIPVMLFLYIFTVPACSFHSSRKHGIANEIPTNICRMTGDDKRCVTGTTRHKEESLILVCKRILATCVDAKHTSISWSSYIACNEYLKYVTADIVSICSIKHNRPKSAYQLNQTITKKTIPHIW